MHSLLNDAIVMSSPQQSLGVYLLHDDMLMYFNRRFVVFLKSAIHLSYIYIYIYIVHISWSNKLNICSLVC